MILSNETSWVILAGGQARRMGGNDKGLIKLNDITLIEHVYQRLAKQTSTIYINANRNQKTYQALAPVFSDEFQNYPGPLAGIHAALMQCKHDWIGFVPCDSPCLSEDLVERFCDQAKNGIDILVAHDGKHKQPVFCLINKRILGHLSKLLESGERKVGLLHQGLNTEFVDFSDTPECFVNINKPADLSEFIKKNE